MSTTKVKQAAINAGELTNRLIFYNSPLPRNDELADYLKRNDIGVRYFNDSELVSFLRYDQCYRQPIIAVNAKMSENLRNVAIAHELAYLVLKYNWIPLESNRNFCSSKRVMHINKTIIAQDEIMQLFMEHFLIPDSQLLIDITATIDSNDYQKIIELIMQIFDVPQFFATSRLHNYNTLTKITNKKS